MHFHARFYHTHTPHFLHTIAYTPFTHLPSTHIFLHTPILHHLFSLSCLSHPIFTFLWLLIGRSWHVGLSGPLILRFLCEVELSLQSRAPIADLIFQKCSEPVGRALSLQSCALFVDNFPRSSRAPAKTETLLRRPRQPLYSKIHRVSRPRVFSSLNSRVSDLLHFPTTWWWCGCHDDVVDRMIDVMMWLPWWWESWPWQSSVTRKFPN